MKTYPWNRRLPVVVRGLKGLLWPLIQLIFRMEIKGLEELQARPTLYVSNHNIGALIESHGLLFEAENKFHGNHVIWGFTHPSIFRVAGVKHYFEWVGAVPATYDVAREVFASGDSLLIFPGGNQQALRSVFDYKKNSFRESHGWAKIAKENKVDVVAVTFKGSHFVNPVLFQSKLLSKLLIFPWLVGLKYLSVSVAQILTTALLIYGLLCFNISWWIIAPLAIVTFALTSLTIIFPSKIYMTLHPRIVTENITQDELEDKVAGIMNRIYNG